MGKYRRLTREELHAVEAEFVRYLASESITSDDWEKKLSTDAPEVEGCLDAFSEQFWDGATGAIDCLEHQPTPGDLWLFHFTERTAHVIHCVHEDGIATWSQGGKQYEAEARGREIFLLLEQGAKPCDEDRFKAVQAEMIAGINVPD
jgi:hypothetical protein